MNIELPESLTVNFAFNLGEQEIDLTTKSADWIMWALAFGLRQSVKDACAGKANTPEGETALAAKFDKVCKQGLIPSSGRGLASGTSLVDRIANKWLTQQGHPGKMANLQARWLDYAKVVVLNSLQDQDPETYKVLKADPAALAETATEYLMPVMEAAGAEPSWAKVMKELTEPKAPKVKPQLGVKITVGPLRGLVQMPDVED